MLKYTQRKAGTITVGEAIKPRGKRDGEVVTGIGRAGTLNKPFVVITTATGVYRHGPNIYVSVLTFDLKARS